MSEPRVKELSQELAVLRTELVAAQRALEEVGEREARLRASRDRARKAATVLSGVLAERLQAETTVSLASRPRWRRGSATLTEEEAGDVHLIRSSVLFDGPWYLRTYVDVARRGEDPSVHFLRHWHHPLRKPSEAFDIAQYVLDHPEVLSERINPLVHFLGRPESDGADAYPPTPR